MDLLKTYDKNKKKHLLSEVTATAGTSTFTGTAGDIVDRKFAGPFHPTFGALEDLLNIQIDRDIAIRMWTDDITPIADQDWEEIDWKYEYDKYVKEDNSKFKNTSETEMQLIDLEIKYDNSEDKTEENKKFINDTGDWKSIYDNKKY